MLVKITIGNALLGGGSVLLVSNKSAATRTNTVGFSGHTLLCTCAVAVCVLGDVCDAVAAAEPAARVTV